jgi:serine/threonine-protein kinase RsbW
MIYRHKQTINEFNLETVNAEIEAFCERNEVPAGKLFSIQLIVEELVTNIIKYGQNETNGEIIEIIIKAETDRISLTLSDNASAFNPLEEELPDTGLSAEERNVGGLGLFLVRKKVKSLSYENKNGFNILKAEI